MSLNPGPGSSDVQTPLGGFPAVTVNSDKSKVVDEGRREGEPFLVLHKTKKTKGSGAFLMLFDVRMFLFCVFILHKQAEVFTCT